MFENLYTTKMSGNTKMLQKRFTKIRSHQSRTAKIMASVVTIMLVVTALYATVALAAVSSDGLEYWDNNEIYFCNSIKFSVNIANKNVPQYVFEDIAGEDGNIDITVKKYQIRRTNGMIANQYIADFYGTKGKISLSSPHLTSYRQNDNEDVYSSEMRFVDAAQAGGYADYLSPFAEMLTPDDGKKRCIVITFTGDKNINLNNIVVNFGYSEYNSPFSPGNMSFNKVSFTGAVNTIGNKKDFFNVYMNKFFTDYEKYHKNLDADKINISVESATQNAIVVKTDINIDKEYTTEIYVYDENNNYIAISRENSPEHIMAPYSVLFDDELRTERYIQGATYRVCVGIIDNNLNLIYRWNDYVTIK